MDEFEAARDVVTIGYVHAGIARHGVSRCGRLLAAEIATRAGVRVVECELELQGREDADRRAIAAAAARLREADVVHIQYNAQTAGCVWGSGWQQLFNLRRFFTDVGRPVLVTLHDVYPAVAMRSVLRHPVGSCRRVLRSLPPQVTLRWLGRHAARLFTCSAEERRRIGRTARPLSVIPLFVEPRDITLTRAEAKAALGWTGKRIVTVLGFIHGRKGHRLVVDALPDLPEDVIAVFAGEAADPGSGVVELLREQAAARGVAHRLFITGYLPEAQLEQHLVATDVAVCPFRRLSASASLSTWISVARPIAASDLPQIAEYNALQPGAIATFDRRSPAALARIIEQVLARAAGEIDPAIACLRSRLQLSTIAYWHLQAYRSVAQHTDGESLARSARVRV